MTKTTSTPSASSAHTADKSAVSNASSSQLGDVQAVAPVLLSRLDQTSDSVNALRIPVDRGAVANDLITNASVPDAIAAWWAQNAGSETLEGSETLTLTSALGVAENNGINIDELLAGIKAPKADVVPVVSDAAAVSVAAPTAADMLALQNILANMEPASGESGGGAGRAGGAGFGSMIDPAVLLGLDRLGGISATWQSGLGDALSGRHSGLGDDGLIIRSAVAIRNDASSSDDSMSFDGSTALFGTGNVLLNDTPTSGALILKTVTLNGIIYDVPETGSVEIMGTMGVLSIELNGDYTYTPLDAKNLGTDISGIDLFEYTAADAAGIVTTATLAVTVNDKIPVAVDDVIAADHMNLIQSGSLLSDDKLGNGAMRLAMVNGQAVGSEGITINRPDLGYKIVIAADGSYTLTADNLRTGVDTLTYSTIDADGDASGVATVAISFADHPVTATSKIIASTNMNLVTEGELITAADHAVDGGAHIASIAGQTVLAGAPLVIDTVDYTLTVSENGHYRLEGKNGHTATNVTLPFTIADSDGDISNAVTVTLSVADAVPVTVDSSVGLPGHLNAATQMITGSSVGTIALSSNGDGAQKFVLDSGSTGSFGTMTLNENGTWVYSLNASKDLLTSGVELVERFTYTVTDSDGDTSTSVLAINIGTDGSWAPVNLTPNAVSDVIDLAGHLNIGTQGIEGSITGRNVLSNGDTVGNNPAIVSLVGSNVGSFGSLTLNADGSYSYVLDSRATKLALQGTPSETFTYQITDIDGDTSTAALTINIKTDGTWSQNNLTPTAVAETISVDGALNLATQHITATKTGSVLANGDNLGDGLARVEIVGSTQGTHGKLTLNADGTFTYALDDMKLNLQGNPTDTFTYRIVDRDGDVSDPVTLTINIGSDGSWSQNNLTPTAVSESIAVDGALNLTTQHVTATKTGSVLANGDTLGDGLARVELVSTGTGAHGTLTLNTDGTYSYTLNDTKQNLQGNPTDTFTYRIIDRDGDVSDPVVLTVNIGSDGSWSQNNVIVDAQDDLVTLTATLSGTNVVGSITNKSVIANDQMGDNPSTVVLVGSNIGKFGTLSMGENGVYTYTLNADKNAMRGDLTETFTYRVTDKDGDTDTATLKISIQSDGTWVVDNTAPIATDGNGGTSVGEVAITGNIVSSLVTSGNGSKTITSISINGGAAIAVSATDSVHAGTHGTLTIRADGTYSYVGKDDASGTDVITYTVRDADGDTATATLRLGAIDISPDAHDDVIATSNMALIKTGNMMTGVNAVSDTVGDGTTRVEYVVLNGVRHDVPAGRGVDIALGDGSTIQIGSDGAYTMSGANQKSGSATLTYGLVDSDGDRDTASIALSWSDKAPIAIDDPDTINGVLNMATQMVTGVMSETIAPAIGAAGSSLGDGGKFSLISSSTGQYGTIVVREDGSYTYNLNAAKNELIAAYKATGSFPVDIFTYRITDSDGDTSEARLIVQVGDDYGATWNLNNTAPDINDVTNNSIATQITPVSGMFPIVAAGDGILSLKVNGIDIPVNDTNVNIDGTNGVLTIRTDKSFISYSYIAKDHANGSDTFTLALTDKDGDRDTSTLTLRGIDALPTANAVTASGSGNGNGDITVTGDMLSRSSGGDGSLRVSSVAGHNIASGGSITLSGSDLGLSGSIVSLTVNSNGSYTLIGAKGANINGTPLSFTVSDQDGDTSSSNLLVSISNGDSVASTPSLSVDPLNMNEDGVARLVINATNNDSDSEQLTVTATIPLGWTVVDVAGGTMSGGVWTRVLGVGESLGNTGPIVRPPENWNGSTNISVSVISTETNGGAVSSPVTVSMPVSVSGVNDAPTDTNPGSTATGNIQEGANVGTSIVKITGISDVDSVGTWTLNGPGKDNFNILPDGTITNKVVLDADAATGGASVYNLTATFSDGQYSVSRNVQINVGNTNDNAPVISGSASGSVSENVAAGTQVSGVNLSASDADFNTIHWEIIGGNTNNAFSINSATGVITTNASLDRESVSAYDLIVRAVDAGGLASPNQTVHIDVSNVNEQAVITGGTSGSINENDTSNVIMRVTATDPDGDAITWSLVGNDANQFRIDANTGEIRVASWSGGLNFENQPNGGYDVYAVATSNGQSTQTGRLSISVGDVNENPILSGYTNVINRKEDAVTQSNSSMITSLGAYDPDGNLSGWQITGGTGLGKFSISAAGIVTANQLFDFESMGADKFFTLEIQAVDAGGLKSSTAYITVNIENVNEVGSISGPSSATVNENLSAGTRVATMTLSGDPEGDTPTWSIISGSAGSAGAFNIDASGNITTNKTFDYETDIKSYTLTVQADDGHGGRVTKDITIGIGDVNEAPVVIDTSWHPSWMTISALNYDDQAIGLYTGGYFGAYGGRNTNEIDFVHDTTTRTVWEVLNGESGGEGWVTYTDYLQTGRSEKVVFDFAGNMATSALVSLKNFNPNDNTGGAEGGHWAAYRNGVLVAQNDFWANGQDLTIPTVAGGFDKLVFSAIAMPTGSWDSSDYGVSRITLYGVDPRGEAPPVTNPGGGGGGGSPKGPIVLNPLVLDLNHDGHINLVSIDHGVKFDMTNDGVKDHTGWVAPEDGQLAVDLNHNGIIDNQNELFGSPMGSPLEINGFTELASYDENGDGKVSSMDSIWSKLIVWQDLNQDGISQANEMKSVVEYQIESISTAATRVDQSVEGNSIYWDGHATMTDGSSMSVVDAYYQVLDGATATHDASTTPAIAADTSSIDAAISTTLTEQLSASETTDLDAAIHEFLLATGKDDMVTIDPVPVARDVVAVSVDPTLDEHNQMI